MSRGASIWGLLLVIFGSLFLLDNLNVISINIWQWIVPAFLIMFGIWVLVGPAAGGKGVEHLKLALDGSPDANIKLSFGAGRLRIGAGAGAGNLIEGEFVGGVRDHTHHQGDTLFASLNMPSVVFPVMPFFPGTETLTWDVRLNEGVTLRIDANVGAAESKIDLSHLNVASMRLSTGASSTTLKLPAEAGFTEVVIKSGIASVEILVPEDAAASIRATAGLGSIQVNRDRFPRIGSKYESQDYLEAKNKIEMVVETGLGSVIIR